MKSILTSLTFVLLASLASGQSLLIITDAFQKPFSASIEKELIQDARMTAERCDHNQVYAHFCSGDGIHYTEGKQNVLLHLDSIPNLTNSMNSGSSWKSESRTLIPGLIHCDFSVDGEPLQIEVFCMESDTNNLKTHLLKDLANALGHMRPDGSMENLSIRIHHGYSSSTGKSITRIQSL